jgi:pimeloyl-ACP methyl ester carboxylesterase
MRGEFIDLDGERLYYYAAGTRGAGDPLILLHGFPTSSHLWSDVVPLLPRGHRVVVVDLLGFGRSDAPASSDYSFAGHARRLRRFMDDLGIARAAIAGHHLGGGIAQAFTLAEPARVTHLALIDSVGFDAVATGTLAAMLAFLPLSGLMPVSSVRRVVSASLERQFVDADRGRRSVEQYLRPFFTRKGGHRHLIRLLASCGASEMTAIGESLGRLSVSTGICVGADDTFVPPGVARRLATLIPHATVDMIEQVRHFTPEEAPQRVADFLGRLLAS